MFKVGKKYKLKTAYSKANYECIFVGISLAVLKNITNNVEFSESKHSFFVYEEVPEELTYDKWHVLFVNSSGETFLSGSKFSTKEEAEECRKKAFKGNRCTAVVNIKHTVEVKD